MPGSNPLSIGLGLANAAFLRFARDFSLYKYLDGSPPRLPASAATATPARMLSISPPEDAFLMRPLKLNPFLGRIYPAICFISVHGLFKCLYLLDRGLGIWFLGFEY